MTSRIQKDALRVGFDNAALIACALVLITADFLVLALSFLHERGQLSVVILGNSLGRHLDLAIPARLCDALLDVFDGLF